MISGAELAIMKACLPAVGRTAGSVATKVAAGPMANISTRLRNRKTRQALADSTRDSAMPHLPPKAASELASFLDSPDFEAIMLSMATQIFAGSTAKKDKKVLDSTFARLKDLIRLHVPSSENNEEIAGAVWGAAKEKVLESGQRVQAVGNMTAETRASMLRVASCFSQADDRANKRLGDLKNLSDFLIFEQQLRDQIKNLYGTMRLPHAGTNRKVSYGKLFVEPRLRSRETESPGEFPTITLASAISNSHRTVILGDPGGGKSTLSLKLAYDIARSAFPGTISQVPLLFILRDYVEAFKASNDTMVEFLESICRNPHNVVPPEGAIEYLLDSGRAFVIFDGLDELTDTSLRRKVVEFVESFVYRYPATPVLVTSRRVGYDEAPLDDSLFTAVSLAELEQDQVKNYADKWFALDESVDRGRRTELAKSFMRESHFVADLRRNPLMLSLMCGIYASEHYIPSNRPDVYKKCAELLFERWDKQRGIVIPLPFDAHVRQALNALALHMYSTPEAQKGLSRDRLVQFMTRFLTERRFEDEAEAEDAANQFVDFCTGRAWVLTDMGSNEQQNLYGFTHRTFLEYFAANQLVRTHSTSEALFDKLHPRILRAEWEVVAQLALQVLGYNVEDGSDDFLSLTLDSIQDTEGIRGRQNLISFAARSLAFVVPRPAIIQRVCQIATDLCVEAVGSAELSNTPSQAFQPIAFLMDAGPENMPTVSRYLKETLLARVARAPEDDRPLLTALSLPSLLEETSIFSVSPYNRNYLNSFTREIEKALNPELERHQDKNYWAAYRRSLMGDLPLTYVVQKYGLQDLWRVEQSYWSNATVALPLFASFRSPPWLGERVGRWSSAASRCFEDLSKILPQTPTPWVPEGSIENAISVTILRFCDGPMQNKSGEERDGVILFLLPFAERELGESVPNYRCGPEGASRWATGGSVFRILRKWAVAREHPEFRQTAKATLRALCLGGEAKDFIERWIDGEVATVGA
ncbi:NACHT domain-containing protein [Streptomyces libani]|uniref:NACHT domain-containing protein n=1 Tax=Streptomyces TaxID=1883 RepID=UPI0022540F79|nr:NACHT domain-containing protein [Streptomyces libani]MCX5449786.1 NACHT domain-containing protein [Streptomyces libani]